MPCHRLETWQTFRRQHLDRGGDIDLRYGLELPFSFHRSTERKFARMLWGN